MSDNMTGDFTFVLKMVSGAEYYWHGPSRTALVQECLRGAWAKVAGVQKRRAVWIDMSKVESFWEEETA